MQPVLADSQDLLLMPGEVNPMKTKNKMIILIALACGIGSMIFQIRMFLYQLQNGGISCLEDTPSFLMIEFVAAIILVILMIYAVIILLKSK